MVNVMEETILDLLKAVLGYICLVETTDGSIRRERIDHVGYKEIMFVGVMVRYPRVLYFSESDGDGVDLATLRSIKLDERKKVIRSGNLDCGADNPEDFVIAPPMREDE
jgi:hypothetical protein